MGNEELNKEFNRDFMQRRKDYLIERISKELKDLDQKELEDIHFLIEKRKKFIGFDAMGREIYNFPQPGPNSQFQSGSMMYPPNPFNMRP